MPRSVPLPPLLFRQAPLAFAIAAVFASGTAQAISNVTIGGTIFTTQTWDSGFLSITSSGAVLSVDPGILATGTGLTQLVNQGTLSSLLILENTLLSGASHGIENSLGALIGTLDNQGTILSGILNNGTISQLLNRASGVIQNSSGIALDNTSAGFIGTLSNSGTLSGDVGIFNGSSSSINSLNNSGLISGQSWALQNSGHLGTLTNSGTISGNIESSERLTLNGGSGNTFGVLTGASGGLAQGDTGRLYGDAGVVFGSGNLLLNDDLVAGTAAEFSNHIGSGGDGDFSGFGTLSNQAATLQINNRLVLAGHYEQAAAGRLLFGVSDSAVPLSSGAAASYAGMGDGYGALFVYGSVTLQPGTTLGLSRTGSSYAFAPGQRYLVIGAADGAGSQFNAGSLNYQVDGFSAHGRTYQVTGETINGVSYDPAYLAIEIDGTPRNSATTRNAQSALGGLGRYTGIGNAALLNLYNASAALGSGGEANRAGAQLSPAATGSAAANASTDATVQMLGVAFNHLDGLRGGAATGLSSGDSSLGKGLWMQGFGGRSSQDERDEIAGYHANYGGLLLGADAELNERWRAGALLSYAHTSLHNDDTNDGSGADIDSYGVIGYASYSGDPWYLDLSAGVLQHQYDTRRRFDVSGVTGTARGDYDGLQYLLAAQAGYPLALDPHTTLTPIVGLTYSTLEQDSYTEKGGNGGALHVQSDDFDSLRSELGAKIERSIRTTYGELIPAAQLSWRHEYMGDGLRSVANFSADVTGETSFVSRGADALRDTGVLSLGLTLVSSDRLNLSARYSLEGGGGYTASTGNLQARWAF